MFQYTFLNPELNLVIDTIILSFKIIMEKLEMPAIKYPSYTNIYIICSTQFIFGGNLANSFWIQVILSKFCELDFSIQGQKDEEDIGKFFQKHLKMLRLFFKAVISSIWKLITQQVLWQWQLIRCSCVSVGPSTVASSEGHWKVLNEDMCSIKTWRGGNPAIRKSLVLQSEQLPESRESYGHWKGHPPGAVLWQGPLPLSA